MRSHRQNAAGLDGWVALDDQDERRVWDRFYAAFDFRPSIGLEKWPSLQEPVGSSTWDLTDAFEHDLAGGIALGGHLRDGLMEVGGPDASVYALDWQHQGYRFSPSVGNNPTAMDSWPVPWYPDGDYYFFVDPEFRFGWLCHPWEMSVCVFGGLLDVIRPHLEMSGAALLRTNGQPV